MYAGELSYLQAIIAWCVSVVVLGKWPCLWECWYRMTVIVLYDSYSIIVEYSVPRYREVQCCLDHSITCSCTSAVDGRFLSGAIWATSAMLLFVRVVFILSKSYQCAHICVCRHWLCAFSYLWCNQQRVTIFMFHFMLGSLIRGWRERLNKI